MIKKYYRKKFLLMNKDINNGVTKRQLLSVYHAHPGVNFLIPFMPLIIRQGVNKAR